MKAEILAVGTELLLGDILNTNAQFLAQELAALGIEVYYQTVVGDNPGRLEDTIFHAFSRADLIITTGGLGPTEDDLTKETAAKYFGENLVLDEKALAQIEKFFKRIGREMTENNVKQAMVPEKNGVVLYNENGTAPGIIIEKDGKMIVMLPGPPKETVPMFLNQVKPYLAKKQEATFVSRILRVAGVGESAMETAVKDMIDAQTNPTIAPYAKDGESILRITARAKDEEEANRLIDPVAAALRERLGHAVSAGKRQDACCGGILHRRHDRVLADRIRGHFKSTAGGLCDIFQRGKNEAAGREGGNAGKIRRSQPANGGGDGGRHCTDERRGNRARNDRRSGAGRRHAGKTCRAGVCCPAR